MVNPRATSEKLTQRNHQRNKNITLKIFTNTKETSEGGIEEQKKRHET